MKGSFPICQVQKDGKNNPEKNPENIHNISYFIRVLKHPK